MRIIWNLKKACQREGRIYWCLLMGLATLADEVDAVKQIYEFRSGPDLSLDPCCTSPSGNVACRKNTGKMLPKTTSFYAGEPGGLDGTQECGTDRYQPERPPSGLPEFIETTVNALKAGAVRVGSFGQFLWDYPGFTDDVKRYSDMVTSLGIMASKRDDMFAVETYLDDSFPGISWIVLRTWAMRCLSIISVRNCAVRDT